MGFPLLDILGIAGKVIDKFIPDPQAKAAAQLQLLQMQQTGELAALAAETDLAKGQLDIDKTEAASSSLFVAGWRPFIGWVSGAAFAFQFVLSPLLTWLAALHGTPVTFPSLDMGTLLTLLLGMLGLGGLRTKEKLAGVAK